MEKRILKILVNFYANISEGSVNSLIGFLTQQIAQQTPEAQISEIIMQISSSGGSSDHGLLAYNFLKQITIPKTTIGMGNVDSAAVMLFCAGDKRLAMPGCRFVLHQARLTLSGSGEFSPSKLTEIAKMGSRITSDYSAVIANVTEKPQQLISKKVNVGTVMSSEEAKKLGLVTHISSEPYLSEMRGLAIALINNPVNVPAPQPNSQLTP